MTAESGSSEKAGNSSQRTSEGMTVTNLGAMPASDGTANKAIHRACRSFHGKTAACSHEIKPSKSPAGTATTATRPRIHCLVVDARPVGRANLEMNCMDYAGLSLQVGRFVRDGAFKATPTLEKTLAYAGLLVTLLSLLDMRFYVTLEVQANSENSKACRSNQAASSC